MISDGWLINHNQIILRVFGNAVKFYKAKHEKPQYRLRVSPTDLRHREVRITQMSSLTHINTELNIRIFQADAEVDDDEESEDPPPSLPSFSRAQIAVRIKP